MANHPTPHSPQEKRALRLLSTSVRQWREQKGLTQEQFAPLADISCAYVREIEGGGRNVSFLNLLKIITTLEVSESEILALFKEPARTHEPQI